MGDASKFFLDGVALGSGGPAISDSTLRTLLYLDSASIATIGAPAALMVLAASWLIWKQQALWRWIALLGAVAGVLLIIGAASPLESQALGILFAVRGVSFLLLVVFVIACSLNLLVGQRTTSAIPTEKLETSASGSAE